MRFRFGEGEEQLFVADILPLLELDDDDSCSGDSSSSGGVVGLHTSRQSDEDSARKVTPAPRLRLRARGKIDRLRREMQTLGVELAGLQRAGRRMANTTGNAEKRPVPSRWRSIAMENKQQRQRAEHDNKVLKRQIAAQHMLAKSILNGRFRLTSSLRCAARTTAHRRFPRINV